MTERKKMPTDVKMKGELDMLRVREPIQNTMMNMSSANNAKLSFFNLTSMRGLDLWVAIDQVSYLIDVPEPKPEGSN